MHDGLASPGGAEILLEWVLRTIGSAERQGEIRRRIFNGAPTPVLSDCNVVLPLRPLARAAPPSEPGQFPERLRAWEQGRVRLDANAK